MSCFVFLSNFVVQYGSTVGMVLSAIICGHSGCKRWQVDRQAGTDARMRPSFKLEGTARMRMLGKGGKTIGDFVRRDIPVIQRYRPDILILLLGDNDIGCDTSAEDGRAKKASLQQTEYTWLRADSTISTNRCAVHFCALA